MNSAIGPGDLVEVVDSPFHQVNWDWNNKSVRPGLQGVALTGPILNVPPPGCIVWCAFNHSVLFPHCTANVAVLLLKKIAPPPLDEETLTEEELLV